MNAARGAVAPHLSEETESACAPVVGVDATGYTAERFRAERAGRTGAARYTAQQKAFAVDCVSAMGDQPGAVVLVAQHLGVARDSLHRWRRAARASFLEPRVASADGGEGAPPAARGRLAQVDALREVTRHLEPLSAADRAFVLAAATGLFAETIDANYTPPGVETSPRHVEAAAALRDALAEPDWHQVDEEEGVTPLFVFQHALGGNDKPACDLQCARGRDGACPQAPRCLRLVLVATGATPGEGADAGED